jgi:hypothetical protein
VRLTCHYPGGYSGVREPGGNPRLLLNLAEGETADVPEVKAQQLLRDFPGYFTADKAPAPRTAAAESAAPPPADEATADESEPTIESAPAGRRGTRRK